MGVKVTVLINSLLVANRGEIASRIFRSATAMGIRTIAVYSDADANAPHVAQADDTINIGAPMPGESYLNIERIIEAAKTAGADAIHPGYGFLSENASFAEACEKAGIVFVGPPADAIALMGNKAKAKRRMIDAGVACVPGYEGTDQHESAFVAAADKIGYPVMVKAAAGGGGRGMRLVENASDLSEALTLARLEAENAFGSGELILEKAIVEPRHIEIQIFADNYSNVLHLGERDCSVQRRHQKVIEEAPSPAVDASLRAKMGAAAVEAARSIGYRGAGTVEFLLDGDGSFYFLEMNTRLQVEHPVTEMITGRDLVALQISVARGEPLGFSQDDVTLTGHAIEVRLYAENPAEHFLPSTGPIHLWRPADGGGVRVDAGIATGQTVSPYYDPMLAKIIAWGANRDEARARLIRALGKTILFGPATNRDFLISALGRDRFAKGEATTAFIAQEFAGDAGGGGATAQDAAIASILRFLWCRTQAVAKAGRVSPGLLNWSSAAPLASYFHLRQGIFAFELAVTATGDDYRADTGSGIVDVQLLRLDDCKARFLIDGQCVDVSFLVAGDRVFVATSERSFEFGVVAAAAGQGDLQAAGGRILAPMHGRIGEVMVAKGDAVSAGDRLVVLEAMKMQHQIEAPVAGQITAVHAEAGDQVAADDLLIEIEIADSDAE